MKDVLINMKEGIEKVEDALSEKKIARGIYKKTKKELLDEAKEKLKKARTVRKLIDVEMILKKIGGNDVSFISTFSKEVTIARYKKVLKEEIEKVEEILKKDEEIMNMIKKHEEAMRKVE